MTICYSAAVDAYQCGVDSGASEAEIYACAGCNDSLLGVETCDDVDCAALTGCYATNCGGCADAMGTVLECALTANGCPSCSAKDSVEIPEFMKDLSGGAIEVFKRTAAQKRQSQRDARRQYENPNRSRAEENRERARKERQNRNSGRSDPYRNSNGSRSQYGRDRDAYRRARCRNTGRDCDENELEDSSADIPRFMKDLSGGAIEVFKRTAAQKRQSQRDARRQYENPNRSRAEENRERARKERQNRNSGRSDPYRNSNGSRSQYGRDRDAYRRARCRNTGRDCDDNEE